VLAATAFIAAGAGGGAQAPHLLGPASVTVSPDGDGVNDVVRLHVDSGGAFVHIEGYAWGGRLTGWRKIVRKQDTDATTLTWNVKNARGGTLRDGSYIVSVCKRGGHGLAHGPGPARPGAAEASVARPPWLGPNCLSKPVLVRVQRLSAYVPSAKSYAPGSLVPIRLGTDKPRVAFSLEHDGSDQAPLRVEALVAGHRVEIRLPSGLSPGLYHVLVSDDRGNQFRAPLVVRAPFATPPPHTALVVWPYLSWRAYNGWDANGDGRPDSWYQFWQQRAVSLVGPLLAAGVESDHNAAAPFSRWLVLHPAARFQSITDVELGSLSARELARYAAIVFPGHTEYYVPSTYDRVKAYRDHGGNLIFLQANPFNRSVRVDAGRNRVVLTDFEARGSRSDFALTGVGYDGCCFPRSHWEPYVAARRGFSKVAWLFAGTGVGPGERFGLAGIEDDRTDPALTPPDHVVAAEALIRGKHGVVHSEMVYTRVPGGGSVFASGNFAFLRIGQKNDEGRPIVPVILNNLWRKFVGGVSPSAPGQTLRFTLPHEPRTLDPALAADLPSLNVSRSLYAGLTRFTGSGVVPDLAESWRPSQSGLVWTFKLRAGLGVTADDFRRAWLHALDPSTGSPYARAEMLNIRGARAYHSGSGSAGDVGVQAVDARTLRVTLQHPVPWFDQQVGYPVFAPKAATGPFRLASWKHGRSIALAKNDSYWDAADVAPGRIELRFGKSGQDGVLPAGTVAPGFPWIETAGNPPPGSRSLPTLAVQYLWFATRHTDLANPNFRAFLASDQKLHTVAPPTVRGYDTIRRRGDGNRVVIAGRRPTLKLAYTVEDPRALALATKIKADLASVAAVRLIPVGSLRELAALAGPPPRADLVLLGWSGEFFDAYNFYDQFACSSALNVAQWCDPSFDKLMHKAVRTLDDKKRWGIEQQIESRLTGPKGSFPALPLYTATEHVLLRPGVRGFEWSPIGFWDLRHVRRG
jgi:ABC-type transport system substrate-binding protein